MNTVDAVRHDLSLLTEQDIYLFREGRHYRLYEKLGAHLMDADGVSGCFFAVWAPNARSVSVISDQNGWDPCAHPLAPRLDSSGIWQGFVPGMTRGAVYKYHLVAQNGQEWDKRDPFALFGESPPESASIVWDTEYFWTDKSWMAERGARNALDAPWSVYEMHLGSWRRKDNGELMSFVDLAGCLPEYLSGLGFTHVEFLPVMEHPFYGSWGYQTTGYFSPSSRFGSPQEFMDLVNALHRAGIGVVLDWVPSHFPNDEYGLHRFDGTHLYDHEDPRRGFHPDWNSCIFNLGRYEVRSFLISSAMFWLDAYHADGLRVDAVASMLYLDYSRKEGEWIPNEYGGRENLEAIDFLRTLNSTVYQQYPDVQTIAEESTSWPMVSRPVHLGGLGFGMKWNMGWMHDTLEYFSMDPVFRKYHQDKLTFALWYAYTENFMLPLSHDEVVYGKGSLFTKMPGDDWQKWAGLRLLYSYMYTMPGKKLLFMGAEFGQHGEWNHDGVLEWGQLEGQGAGLSAYLHDLNMLLRSHPALHGADFLPEGFEWVDFRDAEESVIAFLRRDEQQKRCVLAVLNFTPVPRENYRLGVPWAGFWKELLCSDAVSYGGSGWGNYGGVQSDAIPSHGHEQSVEIALPPLGAVLFECSEG
ncbi:1,4-alpha-glucan branching protein GlgB [Desulfobaculum bizertense]|uniref:1,4-alpha-glucan branching protein GlgB n=1 Tax=Desulfobaculum bizertense TaxID=376490 RepID=UPI001F226EF9|nr:1,4-alpha-glucan branching protein GlgB [Desulfobaculum bizertense]UIJ37668.1 1,4-alpha-glucan branching protein GlgB [Desulfobaculum bizertense]